MTVPAIPMRAPIGDVARMLGIPSQTINSWRNRGLLPEYGEYRGDTKARHYGFDEIVGLEIMRELTTQNPPTLASSAASIAAMCLGEFRALKGRVSSGSVFALEAGVGSTLARIVTADELPERINSWLRQRHHARLELVDVRQIALRVSAKLARHHDRQVRDKHSEKEVMDLIEPFFQDRIAEYLEEERERYEKTAAEKMKAYA